MTTKQTMSPAQQNAFATEFLLGTGIQMVKQLPVSQSAKMGSSIQIPLQRMGILTGVLLQFTVPLDITGAGTLSPVAPWNLAQSVRYTDFAGVDRTRTNGFQLFAAQAMKAMDLPGLSSYGVAPDGISGVGQVNTNIIQADTAAGANQTLQFSLWVPMAYDPTSDLRGAVLTQTNVGEHYITINLAQALVGADPWSFPYTAGTMTTSGVTVQAFQYYIQPQSENAIDLPQISLSTIYGFEGGYKTQANIASGQSTYMNYPNNRSVMSALFNYENGGAFTLNETDINLITMVVNSNTNFREMNPRLVRESMRHTAKGDLPSGTYYIGSRRNPIMTQLYANVQAKFDVVAANAGITQFLSQYEVMYPSGTPLPGVVA
jgi:hypothetical protein